MSGRGVWWLLGSAGTGNLADGIGKVAFPLLATTLTRDPVQIGALSATQFVPWLLVGTVAGALVDRVDRRRAMVLANLVRAVVVLLTAVLVGTGTLSIWLVYLAALLLGAAETVAESAANAVIPAVVERDRLEGANSRFQAAEILGQTFLGGPVGSATFALFALLPFLLSSAGFAIAAALLLGLAGGFRPSTPAAAVKLRTDLADGLRWLARNPLLLRLVLIAGLISVTSELAQAQLVLYALEDLGLSDAAFGVFSFVGGLGGLAGAAATPWLVRRTGRVPVLLCGILAGGLGFLAMGLVRDVLAGALGFGLFAAAVVAVNVVLATARHALVPGELLGRVLGAWRTVVWGAVPVGALLGGALTRLAGSASATFVVSGVAQIVLAGVAVLLVRGFTLGGTTEPSRA
ncbi:MFS family permease [Amycolatopsis bartoniae]|uniref:MFS transporter n=1 Tax=Amycolatopsis bartoniae TaxID=941986 RepID=A0A8H9MDC1_9PSEU|nr:MFS transporter [Amycolatopsis bartoniae]MBB2936452.1 MFS family permease [Amycolatopsis bartoniae]TVT11062.1 MFS transporter [Amycolatopsis bartoniae]GHF68840.1 MFS transporter [Amycolatopsis bartoniae]